MFGLLVKCLETYIGWIVDKFGTDIHGAWRRNRDEFCGPLTFPLALPEGQHFQLFYEIFQHLDGLSWFPDVS